MAITQLKTGAIADDAVTTDKLANAINTERTANTAKVSTTINNNADNRVITGSGTANTLEGEANLTYNGTRLNVGTGDLAVTGAEGGDAQLRLTADEGDDGADYWRLESKASDNNFNLATYASGAWVDKISVRSDGEVHIGTIEGGDDRGAAAIKAVNDTGGSPISVYFQEASGAEGYGVGVDSDGDLNFHNSGSTTPTLEVKDDNNVAITSGNLIIGTSGKGIDFSATSDASGTGISMDNELFKDYEEGSWTPVIKKYSSGSWVNATMTTAGTISDCYYVKIGDIVHFHIGWSGFEVSDASYCVIGGLPFASTGRGTCVVSYTTAFNNHQNQGGHISSGGDQQIQFYHTGNAWNAFNNNTSGLYIYADGWYRAA